jgi:hypothetical protein
MNFTLIFMIVAMVVTAGLLLLSFYLLNKKLNTLLEKTTSARPATGANPQLLTLKIQAYERVLLYIERMDLEGLVMRTFLPEMTVQQLQAALLRTIREEFEHNTTQQLYVSELTWEHVKSARTLILGVIAQACKDLLPSDNGMQLAQTLFACVQEKEIYDFSKFPILIKREMEHDFAS